MTGIKKENQEKCESNKLKFEKTSRNYDDFFFSGLAFAFK
jgi:hypothetical protein